MKLFILSLGLLLFFYGGYTQSVAINTDGSLPNGSAILDIKSSNKGLLIPRMSSSLRLLIQNPATGLMVFDSDTNSFWYYNGSIWVNLSSANAGLWNSSGNDIFNTNSGNVGVGINTPTEKLHVVGNRALFATNYVGIGVGNPATGFTSFQINSSANTFLGMYVNPGATGTPFYGYALNGTAKSYTSFNSAGNQFEYHQTSDATPDFLINANIKAVFNTGFVGIGTSTPTTAFTSFAIKSTANSFMGMYIDAGTTGLPFYGYALNGTAKSYTTFNGTNNQFEYHQTSDATPDFLINGNIKAVFNTGFVGIGTSTPTTAFTSFAIKSTANSFMGMYIDAGTTGLPFYGYALNGTAKSYTTFNGTNNQFEYHQTSDATPDFLINGNIKAVFNTGFVGIGTSTPTTGFTGFAMKTTANTYYGSYVDAGTTGIPFYGYALNGTAAAYTTFNGTTNRFEYHHTTDATPDFAVSNTQALFPIQTFLGLGTSTPTTGFTGFTMKSNVNTYYGSYIDAGSTGIPFYGYALNGTAVAYTTYNGTTNQFEYHHTTDATPDFSVSNTQVSFPIQTALTIGTNTQLNSFTGLTLKNNVNTFYGMYIDAGATGDPFYGYALNGVVKAYSQINGSTGNWELNIGGLAVSVTSAGVIHAANLNGGATTLSTDASGNIIRTPSDANLKDNIDDIDNALDKVMKMHGVTYNFKDAKRFGSDRQIGFLAQELEKVVPEAVSSGEEYKSVNYQVLTALLAEAIKDQQKQIDKLSIENQQLKTLQSEVEALKKLVISLSAKQ